MRFWLAMPLQKFCKEDRISVHFKTVYMKNIIEKMKKSFGIVPGEKPAAGPELQPKNDTGSFIPSTLSLRDSIIGFITQSLQPYVDEKSISIARLDFYVVCSNRAQEEA